MGIIDNNGKMYLWGGGTIESNDTLADDMLILDTIKNQLWRRFIT